MYTEVCLSSLESLAVTQLVAHCAVRHCGDEVKATVRLSVGAADRAQSSTPPAASSDDTARATPARTREDSHPH